jgi:serine/threonine protein kinase
LSEFRYLIEAQGHPHIIKAYSYTSDAPIEEMHQDFDGSLIHVKTINKQVDFISMEYCKYGDLFNLVKNNGRLSPALAKFCFIQMLDAVEHLHQNIGVAHLDLKLENILIGSDIKLKLCDFGFAQDHT